MKEWSFIAGNVSSSKNPISDSKQTVFWINIRVLRVLFNLFYKMFRSKSVL